MTAAATLGVLLLTALLVRGTELARPRTAEPELTRRFSQRWHNALSAELEGLRYVRKRYAVPAGAVAPTPDPACYGETEDAGEIQAVIAAAGELLEGQEIAAWSPEVVYRPGTALRYYRDDSILALAWKEVCDGVVTTFCEVMLADASQLRRKLAGDYYGSGVLKTASLLAAEENAVAAINGDYYAFRTTGVRVVEGQVMLARGGELDTCFFDRNGDMHLVRAGELTTWAAVQRYVEENDVSFSVSFGPVLVQDGVNVTPWDYPVGEINDVYARSAIGQIGPRHYLLMTMGFETEYRKSHVSRTQAELFCQRGCRTAYALDGGQTATIHLGGELVNTPTFGWERNVSDILCFVTAVPERSGG